MSMNAVAISVKSLAGIFLASRTRTNRSAAPRTTSRTTTTGDSSDRAIRHSSLPEGRLAKRALERQFDALARELALAAEEPYDAVEIGTPLFDIERVGDIRMQEDSPHVIDHIETAERLLN